MTAKKSESKWIQRCLVGKLCICKRDFIRVSQYCSCVEVVWAVVLHFRITVCFSVFWDLYCAAPERRDTCEHSSEAKAFYDHDYVSCFRKSMSTVALVCKKGIYPV